MRRFECDVRSTDSTFGQHGKIGQATPAADATWLGPLSKTDHHWVWILKKMATRHSLYPEDEVALLIDVGKKVEGGAGPRVSIFAFSGLCQHMGCPVNYKTDQGRFVWPCHDSVFDALYSGNTVDGPSPTKLPRIP